MPKQLHKWNQVIYNICFWFNNYRQEVDNIATIKDLIRKNLGVSILPRSTCLNELRAGKLTALPIENLSMIRETNILYPRDFDHTEILDALMRIYRETAQKYR